MPENISGKTDGESTGVGSVYKGELVERENKSNPRNQGPDGSKSAVGPVPQTTEVSRKTGQV